MKSKFLLSAITFLATITTIQCNASFFAEVFETIVENLPGPNSDDAPGSDNDNPIDSSLFREAQGNSNCARVAGCKSIEAQLCTGPSGSNQCPHCFHTAPVNSHNIMRADFYNSVANGKLETMKQCSENNNCPFPLASEFAKLMVIADDRIALSAQGAPYRNLDVPSAMLKDYTKKYCNAACIKDLKRRCEDVPYIKHLRNWCIEIVEWVQDTLPNLKGPGSYVAHLAQLATESREASFEEKAALVAAAASSIFLTGHWWAKIEQAPGTDMSDFGFAVQHSLFLAIYDGRLRVTIQQVEGNGFIPGQESRCTEDEVERANNFAGESGNVYAAICSAFRSDRSKKTLRYRPEIHERSNEGCVERKSGMIFILPGDWITKEYDFYRIGKASVPKGLAFSPNPGHLTNLELYPSGVAQIFPPAVAENIGNKDSTACTDAEGNGDSLDGTLGMFNLKGVGGICNWLPSW